MQVFGWFEPLIDYGLAMRGQKVPPTATILLKIWIKHKFPTLPKDQRADMAKRVSLFLIFEN